MINGYFVVYMVAVQIFPLLCCWEGGETGYSKFSCVYNLTEREVARNRGGGMVLGFMQVNGTGGCTKRLEDVVNVTSYSCPSMPSSSIFVYFK